ncbi:MAG: lysylphosphatidylglycerol synthase domain-containing protein [Phycisphaerales bacterium]
MTDAGGDEDRVAGDAGGAGDGGGGGEADENGAAVMPDPTSSTSAVRRILGGVLGLALLAGAAWLLWSRRDGLADAATALRNPDPLVVLALFAAIVANLGLTGWFFHVLFRRHGTVGRAEMQAVMAAATLLNYLPLRPGMPGRVAYHARVHAIPVRRSVGLMIGAVVLSAGLAAMILGLVWIGRGTRAGLLFGLMVPAVGLAIVAAVRRDESRGRTPWAVAGLIRMAEVGCIALRTWASFALVGVELGVAAAAGLAAVAVVVTIVPLTSNGLGLREWTIGLLAPVLADVPLEVAVTADLVARAGELLVAAVAGGGSMWWLARRHAGGGVAPRPGE